MYKKLIDLIALIITANHEKVILTLSLVREDTHLILSLIYITYIYYVHILRNK